MNKSIVHTWDKLTADSPMPLIDRKRIIGKNLMISHVFLHRGFKLDVHQHDNEQFSCVLSGRVRFVFADGSTEELVAGQVLELPANVPHGAEALEDSILLDLFSPVSLATGIDQKSKPHSAAS